MGNKVSVIASINIGPGTLCLGSAKELCYKAVHSAQKAFPFTKQGAWCGMKTHKQTFMLGLWQQNLLMNAFYVPKHYVLIPLLNYLLFLL